MDDVLAIGALIALAGAYSGKMRLASIWILAGVIYIFITWGMYV